MTINDIKKLTKFLTEEEVDKIKQEIKSKETILKSGKLEEGEMVQVLNTLFAILVIEKTLEKQVEEVEEIRGELENELLEAYQIYDAYMDKYKKEEKKKKKRWLLDFLALSELIKGKKETVGGVDKTIKNLNKEIEALKQQRSDANLRNVVQGKGFDRFCDCPHECHNPHHNHEVNELRRGRPGRDHDHDHDHNHRRNRDNDGRTNENRQPANGSRNHVDITKMM